MAIFPTFPTSGKNSAVLVSTGDGPLLTLEEMTLQASKKYNGEFYTDRIYTLGAGRTLINMRPAEQPEINVDGVLQGYDAVPGSANDEIDVDSGIIEVDGAQVTSTATTVTVSRPALDTWAWNLITVNTSTGVISITKGTDTATDDEDELLLTYGSSAGQKPLIAADELLLNAVKVFSSASAAIPATAILYTDREIGGISYEILPNIGGVLLQSALKKVHTGDTGRKVKFTGRFLDELMVKIGTAKSWQMTPQTTETTEETFGGGFSQTEIGSWSFSFEQLAADKNVVNAAFERQGHCAVRLQFPNGFAFQSVATVAPTINSQVGSMININVSGSFGDQPQEYTGA